jgi:hypothetical protein
LTLHSKNAGGWAESQLEVHSQQDIHLHLYFCSTSTFNKKTSPFREQGGISALSAYAVVITHKWSFRFRNDGVVHAVGVCLGLIGAPG